MSPPLILVVKLASSTNAVKIVKIIKLSVSCWHYFAQNAAKIPAISYVIVCVTKVQLLCVR